MRTFIFKMKLYVETKDFETKIFPFLGKKFKFA